MSQLQQREFIIISPTIFLSIPWTQGKQRQPALPLIARHLRAPVFADCHWRNGRFPPDLASALQRRLPPPSPLRLLRALALPQLIAPKIIRGLPIRGDQMVLLTQV